MDIQEAQTMLENCRKSESVDLTQSMSKSMSKFKTPNCRHGNRMDKCDVCRKEAEKYDKATELVKIEKDRKLKKARSEHPERWMKGVPKKYLTYSFDSFNGGALVIKMCCNFVAKYPSPESLLFTGPPGCGKTHLAMAICRELIREDRVNGVGPPEMMDIPDYWSTGLNPDVAFTTIPELLLEIRATFNDSVESESGVIGKYSNVDLLILDDLGAEKSSEFAIQSLYVLIDRRNRELKPTVITTNLSLAGIEAQLNSRIASRLAEMKIIKLNMPDYRKKR
ncbi:MAG TPA: AAA family ATPase [Nitrospirae bacterium]|nr:AAA family ATPase [Nitrospirota bacterium]